MDGAPLAVMTLPPGASRRTGGIMEGETKDWLRVVYGRGLEPDPTAVPRSALTEIAVRQTPSDLDLAEAEGEQRVRVTVAPSDRAQSWTLWLRDFAPGPADAPTSRVWWRVEPGTWQPLGGTRQCVAEGRGRIRLDVSLRLEGRPAMLPRLRFVAEPAGRMD
jgi:hypothetical protein